MAGKDDQAATETDPAVLAAEIEKTREDLAETLDAIAEKVSPKRAAKRTSKKVATAVKETAANAAAGAKDLLPGGDDASGSATSWTPRGPLAEGNGEASTGVLAASAEAGGTGGAAGAARETPAAPAPALGVPEMSVPDAAAAATSIELPVGLPTQPADAARRQRLAVGGVIIGALGLLWLKRRK